MGSGGVRTAPKIRNTTIANFLYSLKNAGVSMPILVKNVEKQEQLMENGINQEPKK